MSAQSELAERPPGTDASPWLLIALRDAASGTPLVHTVYDLTRWHPVLRQLEYTAVGHDPDLAGVAYVLTAELDDPQSTLWLSACPERTPTGKTTPFCRLPIPYSGLQWAMNPLLRSLPETAKDTILDLCLVVVDQGHPAVAARQARLAPADDGIELTEEQTELRFPTQLDFVAAPPTGDVMLAGDSPSWLRCAFAVPVLDQFRQEARTSGTERQWLGFGRVHAAAGCVWCVVERLRELPGSADASGVLTSGHEYAETRAHAVDSQAPGLLCAHLHLHPRWLEDNEGQPYEVGTSPSPWDRQLAWDLSATTPAPVCFAITHFGPPGTAASEPLETWGYDAGSLIRIPWKVLK